MSDDPLAHWLLTGGPAARDLRTAFQELIEQLEGEGIPLLRTALNVDMLHPEMLAAMYTWQRGDSFVKRSDTPHGIQSTGMYLGSPFRMLNEGESCIRRRLTGPDANLDSTEMEDFRELGATDYLAMALQRSDGGINRCSFATDQEGGFTDTQIARLQYLRPYISIMAEVHGRARMTRTLLDLYLGTNAGPRIYGGQVKRGEGTVIHSVLFISDLRGFTKLS